MSFFTKPSTKKIGNVRKTNSTYIEKAYYYIATEKEIDVSKPEDSFGPEDYSLYYGNSNAAKIFITYVKAGYTLVFPSIIDSISDSLKPTFNSEQIYGFTDGIQKFSNTSRTITLSFKVLAYDEQHAKKNLDAISALAEFMYPVYDGAVKGSICNALVLREPPMLRLRFSNIIQRTARGNKNKNDNNAYMAEDGLLIVPTSLNFAPNLEAGFFIENDNLFPKEIKITLNCNVLHEETLGWTIENNQLHWIGKLNNDGKVVSKNVNFPWGNDFIKFNKNNSTPANKVITPSSTPTGSAP